MVREHIQDDPLLADRRFSRDEMFVIATMEDDTEEAAWMVMNDAQVTAASTLLLSLRVYAQEQGLTWFVGSMLRVIYNDPATGDRHQVAPDLFVAYMRHYSRTSYIIEREGKPPAFVLEIISPESETRDVQAKRLTYDFVGVQEYALFDPSPDASRPLWGFRRGDGERFAEWEPGERGGLWSEALELRLFVESDPYGQLLRAETRNGRKLLTLAESERERARSDTAREQAEAEAARLRAELERLERDRL